MAKKATMKEKASEAANGVAPTDLQRVVGDVLRNKENAAESNGLAGQTAKNAIERYGLDRKAFSIICGLKKADDQKRQTTIRCLVEYARKMGFLDQHDAFSDVVELFREIVKEADARDTGKPSGGKPTADNDGLVAMLN